MNEVRSNPIRRWLLIIVGAVIVLIVGGALLLFFSEGVRQRAKIEALDQIGSAAESRMAEAAQGEGEGNNVAAEFINNPVEARKIADGIWQATGVANTHLIQTSAGDVLFDTGLSTQAGKQFKALEAAVGDINLTRIIVSHSHADHSGGVKLWQRDGVEIIAHEEFTEEQRYLAELQPYLWGRNRTLFPFMPEEPPTLGLIAYGGVEPTLTVDNDEPLRFNQGGVEFEVLGLPGAEGSDNLVLWLPQRKILLSGDFFGPIFPQFPNIFTMRGEKIRKPVEYIASLDRIIALGPQMIVPSHKEAITDPALITEGLVKMRDATQFVHDETVAAMNAGKTLEQAMQSITLPPELALTQEHGKVSWAVKSIWEYYATWFHFDRTTELFPVPMSEIYSELAELAGADALAAKGRNYIGGEQPEKALHFADIVLEGEPNHRAGLELRRDALVQMLERVRSSTRNSYEIYCLDTRLRETQDRLGE